MDKKPERDEKQPESAVTEKRKLLKSIVVGGAAAGLTSLPDGWKKPVVSSIMLPAHAATTSGAPTPGGAPTPVTTAGPSRGALGDCPPGYLTSISTSGLAGTETYRVIGGSIVSPGGTFTYSGGSLVGSNELNISTAHTVACLGGDPMIIKARKYQTAANQKIIEGFTSTKYCGSTVVGTAVSRSTVLRTGTFESGGTNTISYAGGAKYFSYESCDYLHPGAKYSVGGGDPIGTILREKRKFKGK